MRLDPTNRQVIADMIAEAHDEATEDGVFASREVASILVAKLNDAERFGRTWIARYRDDLAVVGAMKVCADWRRAKKLAGRTKRGKVVDLPAYAGTTTLDGAPVQTSFAGMDLEELRAHRKRMIRTRDTLSVEVAVFDRLIKIMEASATIKTVGQALDVLERAA